MKPEVPISIESAKQMNQGVYNLEIGDHKENLPINKPELGDYRSESGAVVSDVGTTTILPTPVMDDTSVVSSTTSLNSPATAADDDLIEKEWVDRAKKIVLETKNDPYQREEAVSKLQIDYLKKRYGRDINHSSK